MTDILNLLHIYIPRWPEYLIKIFWGGLALVISWRLIAWIGSKIFVYPKTQFGFRGKLIYTDSDPSAKVFVSHQYELSAKPDLIYKIGPNKYAIVEYKSRRAPVKSSDVAQLLTAALAVRSQFNVVQGYVVTELKTQAYSFGNSRSIYRQIKQLHNRAKELKILGKKARPTRKSNCNNCGFQQSCFPSNL